MDHRSAGNRQRVALASVLLGIALIVGGAAADASATPEYPGDQQQLPMSQTDDELLAAKYAPIVYLREQQDACDTDGDCISYRCLESDYGPEFCSRECPAGGDPCPEDADAGRGTSLCVRYEEKRGFIGRLGQFCVPRCQSLEDCQDDNPSWESCDVPQWLGEPLYADLGDTRVCLAPSWHDGTP